MISQENQKKLRNKFHVIQEFGTIFNGKDYPNVKDQFHSVYLPNKSFESVKNFIAENVSEDIDVDNAFSVHRKKGKDYIRVKNYVGVIETRDGTSLEILPKILLSKEKDQLVETRRIFLRMLRSLKDSPFKSIDNAHLKSTRFPVLEIFIHTFLEELETLIKKGIRKHYVQYEGNENFLKGSLDFTKQIQRNLLHKERFYVRYDEFSVNIPQNRLIKSTLAYLVNVSRSAKNKIRLLDYLHFMDEVCESRYFTKDFTCLQSQSRLFSHYTKVLSWAKVFLMGESFTNFKGKNLNKAILFPMERIFEDYVGAGFKKHLHNADITLQERKVSLINKHNGASKFRLKPDIIINKGGYKFVLDTKWKIIDQTKAKSNYKINQADMYQLFAYGKKYAEKDNSQPTLILLYPQQESFTQPLSEFLYEDNLCLKVIPVDLSIGLEGVVASLSQKLGLSTLEVPQS